MPQRRANIQRRAMKPYSSSGIGKKGTFIPVEDIAFTEGSKYPLEHVWDVSYGVSWDNIASICKLATIADFWGTFNNIGTPSASPAKCDFYMFHSGIKPEWEYEGNVGGGKWNIDLGADRKVADNAWMNLLMGIVGEQFPGGSSDVINGISIHIRPVAVRCSVWTRKMSPNMLQQIGDFVRSISGLDIAHEITFKLHQESIANGSSYNSKSLMKA